MARGLLDLPPELRTQIYDHLLITPKDGKCLAYFLDADRGPGIHKQWCDCWLCVSSQPCRTCMAVRGRLDNSGGAMSLLRSGGEIHTSILRTCKLINQEALPSLYRNLGLALRLYDGYGYRDDSGALEHLRALVATFAPRTKQSITSLYINTPGSKRTLYDVAEVCRLLIAFPNFDSLRIVWGVYPKHETHALLPKLAEVLRILRIGKKCDIELEPVMMWRERPREDRKAKVDELKSEFYKALNREGGKLSWGLNRWSRDEDGRLQSR